MYSSYVLKNLLTNLMQQKIANSANQLLDKVTNILRDQLYYMKSRSNTFDCNCNLIQINSAF